MEKIYASLIRKGVMTLDDVKNESIRKAVQKILEEG